ncbi:MAG: hypothetical protein RBS24_06085 [Bacilli bacterium]|nr:hypothetical protein [Bacilli bacterium]
MLRSSHHTEVKKLDCLYKAYVIVKDREEYLRKQFRERYLDETSHEYKELANELDKAEEVENFLSEEIGEFERAVGLEIIRNTGLGKYKEYINSALFDMSDPRDNHSIYVKYKNDEALHSLYLQSLPMYDIFDVHHFKELVKYFDDRKSLNDVSEAQFEFTILDKEYEEKKEFNEYKILIFCDNGLYFEIFANGRTEIYEFEKLYSRDYMQSYNFIGTHIRTLVNKFNLLKMMKLILTSAVENKKYKLYLK